MQKRSVQRGRPAGTRTYESEPARAFGVAVREARSAKALAQEVLAEQAGIARSHMGK
ncbi:transcriptional regulator, partial [Pseudomonas aeruginosa]